MKSFNEIKGIWHIQKDQQQVSYVDILETVKKKRSKYSRRLFYHLFGIILSLIITMAIWWFIPFYTWTTHLSLIMVMGAICYYLINQIRDYKSITKEEYLQEPKSYIKFLTLYKQKRHRFNTRNYFIYALFLLVAFALFAIEFAFYVPPLVLFLYIIGTILWFILCHIVFMRLYIHKENTRLQEIIDHLQRIQSQFSD